MTAQYDYANSKLVHLNPMVIDASFFSFLYFVM